MSVTNKHPLYDVMYPKIKRTWDAFCGNVYTEQYVPKLETQNDKQHKAYINRAAYYNVVERTVHALIGALMRKPHRLEGVIGDSPVVDLDRDSFAIGYDAMSQLIQQSYMMILTSGRVGLLCDYDQNSQTPYVVPYSSENVTNWGPDWYVLEETYYTQDPQDRFTTNLATRYREIFLDSAGLYAVRIWTETESSTSRKRTFAVTDQYEPMVRGKRLTFIPFVFATPYDTTTNMYSPPLDNLAVINISHFRTDVEIEHALHMVATPTPWIAGSLAHAEDGGEQVIALGSDRFIELEPGSNIGFLEFSGAGVSKLIEQKKAKEEHMFSLGSRLLQFKAGVESSNSLQIRLGAEGASLITIANALEAALHQVLTIYNMWMGYENHPVTVDLNKDVSPSVVDAQTMQTLVSMYTTGVITLETLLNRLYDGEIVDDVQQEIDQLGG